MRMSPSPSPLSSNIIANSPRRIENSVSLQHEAQPPKVIHFKNFRKRNLFNLKPTNMEIKLSLIFLTIIDLKIGERNCEDSLNIFVMFTFCPFY